MTLRRKSFEVLRYLTDHPGQLVTKTALLDAVWAGAAVSDTMPAVCVGELRKALGDETKAPRFIETVHGRGYRFIAKISAAADVVPLRPSALTLAPAPLIVGREQELEQMRNWFAQVSEGLRQVVFVSGEPGIGKTSFVQSFLATVAREGVARIGRGQCVEQYGAGEPYMPVLEALTRLCQSPGGEQLFEILRRVAPIWLAQMQSLLTEHELARLQSETQGATRQRMLREMAEAIEAIAAETPLILFLEDLHWSDFSTLELISVIARRSDPARLLVIGTYRPVEILAGGHPLRTLKQELELHRQCEELKLKLLGEKDVAAYLALRFDQGGAAPSVARLAASIHERTDGNPLFMVNVVDYLIASGVLDEAGRSIHPVRFTSISTDIPQNILQLIERNLERLDAEERRILEAASLVGTDFSASAAAAAVGQPVLEIEECCTKLARREQFVRVQGASEWPDGTSATTYEFLHALYRDVLYERLPAGQRAELHHRVAEREEAAWGGGAAEIAAELAYHYGRCGAKTKALKYLELAGERAVARRAFREAHAHYRDALAVLETLPESPERDTRELTLEVALGSVLAATRGWSAVDTAEVYARARVLAERVGGADSLQVFNGLWSTAVSRHDLRESLALADQLLEIARCIGTALALVQAHNAQGLTRHLLGDLAGARQHFRRATKHYREEDFVGVPVSFDPGLSSLIWTGSNEWNLGYVDKAVRYANDAISLARRQNNPFNLASAFAFGSGLVHFYRRDFRRVAEASDEARRLSTAFGFPLWNAIGKIQSTSARAQMGDLDGAVDRIQEGLAELNAIRFYVGWPLFLAALGQTQALEGALDDALATVERALEANPDGLLYRPEILRLRGETKLRRDVGSEASFELAERDFRDAIEVARRQGAKSWELRATTSLALLLAKQGRRDEARTMLAAIYNWFTEGFDTADLKDAKALLDELSVYG